MKKVILIDIDNTLIETAKFQMTEQSKLLYDKLRKLPNVKLIAFTARPRIFRLITKWQLFRLGIQVDKLIMAKPRGQVYIGNRAVNFDCRYSDAETVFREAEKFLTKGGAT